MDPKQRVSITMNLTDDELGLVMEALYAQAEGRPTRSVAEHWATWLSTLADDLADQFDAALGSPFYDTTLLLAFSWHLSARRTPRRPLRVGVRSTEQPPAPTA